YGFGGIDALMKRIGVHHFVVHANAKGGQVPEVGTHVRAVRRIHDRGMAVESRWPPEDTHLVTRGSDTHLDADRRQQSRRPRASTIDNHWRVDNARTRSNTR